MIQQKKATPSAFPIKIKDKRRQRYRYIDKIRKNLSTPSPYISGAIYQSEDLIKQRGNKKFTKRAHIETKQFSRACQSSFERVLSPPCRVNGAQDLTEENVEFEKFSDQIYEVNFGVFRTGLFTRCDETVKEDQLLIIHLPGSIVRNLFVLGGKLRKYIIIVTFWRKRHNKVFCIDLMILVGRGNVIFSNS